MIIEKELQRELIDFFEPDQIGYEYNLPTPLPDYFWVEIDYLSNIDIQYLDSLISRYSDLVNGPVLSVAIEPLSSWVIKIKFF